MDNFIQDEKQCILSYMGIYKIKYSVLSSLELDIGFDKKSSNAFHIDLDMMFATLFKIKFILDKYVDNYKFSIVSSILNLVAHFKAYFVLRDNILPIFYLYYDINNFKYIGRDSEKQTKYKIQNKYIIESIKILKIIVKYIPYVYLIDSSNGVDYDTDMAIEYFKRMYDNNIVYTKNKAYYQLVDTGTNNNCVVLRPMRDDSDVITKYNIFNKIGSDDKKYNINPRLYSALISISGINNFKGIKGIGLKRALKLMSKSVNNSLIINEYYPDIKDLLSDMNLDDTNNRVKCNFNKIDIHNKYKKLSKGSIITLKSFIVDAFAKKDLLALNTTYFTDFDSIMINELLMVPKQFNNKKQIKW